MTISVLAVDDSRTIRELISLTLGEAGFEVHLAEDGHHGLEVLETVTPDVILTDINMPRMNGFEFTRDVRKIDRLKKTPILVLTTESAENLKQRARADGATGWIVKPFDATKLIRALELVSG